jgi:hypothetical protein
MLLRVKKIKCSLVTIPEVILFVNVKANHRGKFADHLPLYRQDGIFEREGAMIHL